MTNTTQTQTQTQAPYTTLRQEAARLQLSERTIHRWIKSRRIPSHKLGKSIRLRSWEVDEALDRYRLAAMGEGK